MSFDVTQNPSPDAAQNVEPQAPAPVTPSDPSTVSSVAQAPVSQAVQGKPSIWKDILSGALTGLAGSGGAKSFGAGAGRGAASVLAQRQLSVENERAAQAQASNIKFRDAQAASSIAEAARNNAAAAAMPQEARDAHEQSQLTKLKTAQDLGLPIISVSDDHADHANAALEGITKQFGHVPPVNVAEVGGQHFAIDMSQVGKSPQALGLINQARVASGQAPMDQQTLMQMHPQQREALADKALNFFSPAPPNNEKDAHGNYLQYKAFADAYAKNANADPAIASKLNDTVSRLQKIDQGMTQSATKDKANEAFTAGYNQAKGRLQAEKEQQPQWIPKATNDEKKKAELAENIAENSLQVASMLKRRPELLGAVAGRYTSAEQMMGNNDPDIAAIGTAIHNIAMANSGVHGFRAHEGVKDTETILLNKFRNGPKAIGGALKSLTTSTQTFIDNARPEGYKTHSKQGGSLNGMSN